MGLSTPPLYRLGVVGVQGMIYLGCFTRKEVTEIRRVVDGAQPPSRVVTRTQGPHSAGRYIDLPASAMDLKLVALERL